MGLKTQGSGKWELEATGLRHKASGNRMYSVKDARTQGSGNQRLQG